VKLSKEGRFVISWLWKHLGLSGGVLGRIINGLDAGHLDGLQEKPIDGPCEVLSGRTESSSRFPGPVLGRIPSRVLMLGLGPRVLWAWIGGCFQRR
jgi:hypothetical protein